jgi:hypothetical protein
MCFGSLHRSISQAFSSETYPRAPFKGYPSVPKSSDLKRQARWIFGHSGGGPGFSIAAYSCPEKGVTVAAVVVRDSSLEAEKLVFEALKLVAFHR